MENAQKILKQTSMTQENNVQNKSGKKKSQWKEKNFYITKYKRNDTTEINRIVCGVWHCVTAYEGIWGGAGGGWWRHFGWTI